MLRIFNIYTFIYILLSIFYNLFNLNNNFVPFFRPYPIKRIILACLLSFNNQNIRSFKLVLYVKHLSFVY